jgi:diaminohydroxyphosphoribosylaminopyrimidine deaminase/5-amino-6-(5-phosphoribosylamino)uracil reductase
VAGGGVAELEAAGIEVEVGWLEEEARRLNAPYLKLLETGGPWVIAKWAMTLCGKIATRTGQSRWISCPQSRAIVHELRGRVDAIIVGGETARLDDPLLTARPEESQPKPSRTAVRVVLDTRAAMPVESQLAQTAHAAPVLVAVGEESTLEARDRLAAAGCEVFVCSGDNSKQRLDSLLLELGRRRMTNVLVEGGGRLLGSLFDAGHIDEVHAFIAPKIIGGADAPSPVAGAGLANMLQAATLVDPTIRQVGSDVYVSGRVAVDSR